MGRRGVWLLGGAASEADRRSPGNQGSSPSQHIDTTNTPTSAIADWWRLPKIGFQPPTRKSQNTRHYTMAVAGRGLGKRANTGAPRWSPHLPHLQHSQKSGSSTWDSFAEVFGLGATFRPGPRLGQIQPIFQLCSLPRQLQLPLHPGPFDSTKWRLISSYCSDRNHSKHSRVPECKYTA